MSATRKTIPYTSFDDLECGDELNIKRKGVKVPMGGVFEGFHLDGNGTFWLKIAVPNTLIWIMAAEIQWRDGYPMVQRIGAK